MNTAKKYVMDLLDNDLYKFSLQNFILETYPNERASYTFINRGKQRFCQKFVDELKFIVYSKFPNLSVSQEQLEWFKNKCPYLKPWYFDYLKNYRFNNDEVKISLTEDKNLKIDIEGPWHSVVLWEVPLMATISALYFEIMEKNWTMDGQVVKAYNKSTFLQDLGAKYADFGTRRRRNFETQDLFVKTNKKYNGNSCFVGTSNVHLAYKYDLTPVGTYPHELTMAMSVLEGLRNSNYYAMNAWSKMFGGDLGIALSDTYGTEAFLKNFNKRLACLFMGVRQDSGNPISFAEKIIEHYKKLKIDPMSKTIVFSDNLNLEKVKEIYDFCQGKIKCSFGIGTFFSNCFENSPALNMVIKMNKMNDVPVIKLSDSPTKAMGDQDALRVARWTFFGTPLDKE